MFARVLLYSLGSVILIYLALCGLMFAFQRSLLYFPDPAAMTPESAGLAGVQVQTLATTDGEQLVIWWSPPANPTQPTYLYLHGNGANLMVRAERLRRLIADGSGVMALSWRGYGGSTGRPSESGLMTDARAAYAALTGRVAPDRIVIIGESIGTGIATMLAAEAHPAGLILDSSFTSTVDIAGPAYPYMPVSLLLLDQFRADLAAPRVTAPVLQLHCRDDPVTPLALAQALTGRFPAAHPMIIVEARCHTVPLEAFVPAVTGFAAQTVKPAP